MKQAAQKALVERCFRYVGLVSTLRDSHGIKGLSRQQEELLEFIGHAWHDEKPLSVRKLMSASTFGSTVTIHRWLKVLIFRKVMSFQNVLALGLPEKGHDQGW